MVIKSNLPKIRSINVIGVKGERAIPALILLSWISSTNLKASLIVFSTWNVIESTW